MLAIPDSGRNHSSIIQRMCRFGISISRIATTMGIMNVSARLNAA